MKQEIEVIFLLLVSNTISISCCTVHPPFNLFSECTGRHFGTDCQQECHCADNMQCDKVTGTCPNKKCAPGWKGLPTCETGRYILHTIKKTYISDPHISPHVLKAAYKKIKKHAFPAIPIYFRNLK